MTSFGLWEIKIGMFLHLLTENNSSLKWKCEQITEYKHAQLLKQDDS